MTRVLLDGRFLPVTRTVGFIDAPLDRCAGPFARIVAGRLSVDPAVLVRRLVPGPLEQALAELMPPRDGPSGDRFLLAPTESSWTAFFENAADGGDPRPVAGAVPDELGCRTVTAYIVAGDDGGWDILGFTLAAPGRAGPLDAVRVLILHRQDGGYEVQSYGEPLAAEEGDPAELDLGRLDRILRSLGIRAFDADFYLPPRTEGLLVERRAR